MNNEMKHGKLKLCVGLFLLLFCNYVPNAVAQKSDGTNDKKSLLPVGTAAPDWELTDGEGKLQTLAQYRGKIVVLDFSATWCGSCAAVMPQMQKLHEKYQDKGVVVFGVSTWEQKDPAAAMQ